MTTPRRGYKDTTQALTAALKESTERVKSAEASSAEKRRLIHELYRQVSMALRTSSGNKTSAEIADVPNLQESDLANLSEQVLVRNVAQAYAASFRNLELLRGDYRDALSGFGEADDVLDEWYSVRTGGSAHDAATTFRTTTTQIDNKARPETPTPELAPVGTHGIPNNAPPSPAPSASADARDKDKTGQQKITTVKSPVTKTKPDPPSTKRK